MQHFHVHLDLPYYSNESPTVHEFAAQCTTRMLNSGVQVHSISISSHGFEPQCHSVCGKLVHLLNTDMYILCIKDTKNIA